MYFECVLMHVPTSLCLSLSLLLCEFYLCVYVRVNLYICVCIYMYMYMYMYTYIYTCVCLSPRIYQGTHGINADTHFLHVQFRIQTHKHNLKSRKPAQTMGKLNSGLILCIHSADSRALHSICSLEATWRTKHEETQRNTTCALIYELA